MRRTFHAPGALLVLLATACASGPAPPPGPLARPGQKIVGWAEDDTTLPGKELFLRNDSEGRIRITRIFITECANVRGGCHNWDPELVLEPGQWVNVGSIRPMVRDKGFRYRWRWSWEAAE